jgi:hypothetical protein
MQLFFCVVSVLGLSYFLLVKRRFDWFSVAFFSACTYFLPGFFGYTSYLTPVGWIETPINDEAYRIMILVGSMIFAGAIINDLYSKEVDIDNAGEQDVDVLNVLICLAAFGLILMFLTTGKALFLPDKQIMLVELNRSYILFSTATMIGGTIAYEQRKWFAFVLFCSFTMFDLFIGFRTTLAIMSISIFTLWLSKREGKRSLLHYWKQLLAGIFGVLFLFLYAQIAYAVKVIDFDLLMSVLFDTNIYSTMLLNSEPFVTQSTLNEVTAQNYHVGIDHLKGIFYQIILFAPELGLDAKSFNDLFQTDLFPEVEYGMANNIWAEMWSAGGWPLLLVFIVFFVIILKLMNILTARISNITQRAFVAVAASYWAFYIHRNDINYEIVLLKRVLLVMILSYAVALLIKDMERLQKYPGEIKK